MVVMLVEGSARIPCYWALILKGVQFFAVICKVGINIFVIKSQLFS